MPWFQLTMSLEQKLGFPFVTQSETESTLQSMLRLKVSILGSPCVKFKCVGNEFEDEVLALSQDIDRFPENPFSLR